MGQTSQATWLASVASKIDTAGTPKISAQDLREVLIDIGNSVQWVGGRPVAPGIVSVVNRTTSSPPASPSNGDTYVVASGASGAWASFAQNSLAVWDGDNSPGEWDNYTPSDGWIILDVSNDTLYRYDPNNSPADWVPAVSGAIKLRTITSSTTGVLGDANTIIEATSASTIVYTIPLHASVAHPVPTVIDIVRCGSGTVTITAPTGGTLNGVTNGSCNISAQFEGVSIYKRSVGNHWAVQGSHDGVA